MRILLLGDLSGVHTELYPGLLRAGADVTAGHFEQSTADLPVDLPFYKLPEPAGRLDRLKAIGSQVGNLPRMAGFDIVQLMTPKFFFWRIQPWVLRRLKAQNGALVIVNTSCTHDYFRRAPLLRYRACINCLAIDQQSSTCMYDAPDERRAVDQAFALADRIAVTGYEYVHSLADTPYASKVEGIPLPIDTTRIQPVPMPATDPIVIWYGETRHGFKGGAHILKALERLEHSPLGKRVTIVRTGRLDRADYLRQLDESHIVVDQAAAYGIGMNALYALAKGRVVLSGAEPEALAFHGISAADNPVIPARPDADMLYQSLEKLVGNPDALPALGAKSRQYAETVHGADVVARRYMDLYRDLLGMASDGAAKSVHA